VEARRVGDHVHVDDLPLREREGDDPEQSSTRSQDDSHRTVHERNSREPGPAPEVERLPGPGPRTADLPRCARSDGSLVGPDHDVRVEHREKPVEVPAAQGSEEGDDDFSLAGEIGVGNRVATRQVAGSGPR